MSDNAKLSQAEIDALLNHGTGFSPLEDESLLTEDDKDVLGEVGNISFGAAATSLSALLQQRVEITTPQVSTFDVSQFQNEFPKPYVLVSVDYTDGLFGSNALAIDLQDAKTIADLMLGGSGRDVAGELNELHLSAVAEAMNQMMGGASTAMSTIFGRSIHISPPKVNVIDLSMDSPMDFGFNGWIVKTAFHLRVGQLIDSHIMQLTPLPFARDMIATLNNPQKSSAVSPAVNDNRQVSVPRADEPLSQSGSRSVGMNLPNKSSNGVAGQAHYDSAPWSVDPTSQTSMQESSNLVAASVHRPEFIDFTNDSVHATAPPRNLSLLLDVGLTVTVELGRTKRLIKDILELAPGSILELDKLAGEPVDILVNNKKIAIGEVVVIEENFGVRVTDIVSPVDRVKNLQ